MTESLKEEQARECPGCPFAYFDYECSECVLNVDENEIVVLPPAELLKSPKPLRRRKK